ncbi:MAG: DUF2304 domain-containing protein [Planctomycetes bacterium]|nr:DUF2304 domain-containing protein [Planctomycetota bacterium]
MNASLTNWLAITQEPLPVRQQVTAVLLAVSVLVTVVELVRRRKLREEYSWVWVGTAIALIALALHQDFIHTISAWVGSATATSTLFFFAIVFLLMLALQFSVRLSKLTHRHKTMGQRLALLEEELERLRGAPLPHDAPLPLRETTRARAEAHPDARDGVA